MKNSYIRTRAKLLTRQWARSTYIKSSTQLLMIAIGVGFLGGLGAVVFYKGLHFFTEFVRDENHGLISILPSYLHFLIPAVGGLISGLLVYKLAPETEGHGTDAMIESFHNKGGKVRTRVPFVKAISSIITIGTGGSAGYEGPTAQIGSGMGSILSRLLKVPEKMGRLILLAGTAAGLGAIFRAPLGGALTSVEVIYKEDFESEGFLPCIVASVVAYATYTQITHSTDAIFDMHGLQVTRPVELIFFGLLGALCAPLSWFYTKAFYVTVEKFRSFNIPRHLKPALGGLGVGLIAYVFPEAIGGGWGYLEEIIHSHYATFFTISVLLLVGFFKIVTTCLTVGSGGSGGVFGPSLFIGGVLGGFYGFSLNLIFPHLIANPSAYVLVGMGAFFAGVANAPLASIIMVCEITGNYNLLAPLMFASIIHIMLSRKWSIYKNQRMNKFESPVHKNELNTDVLRSITISNIMSPQQQITFVKQGDDLSVLRTLLEETDVEIYPVIGEAEEGKDGLVVGLLGMNELRKVILETSAAHLVIVEDMMTPLYALGMGMDLHGASQIFLRSKQSQLPVLDDQKKVIGLIRYQDIIQAYDEMVQD